MKIGDRIFVRGYIDEIRKDTVIVRNDGGYFGTILSEVTGELPSAQPEPCEDAVSRQRLLSDLKELVVAWEKYPVMAEQIKGVETAIGYVETIPTAHPKHTEERTETHACDSISRQTVLDALAEISREVDDGYGFNYAKWREYFCELPPEHSTNLAEVGTNCSEFPNNSDAISRQQAIDALYRVHEYNGRSVEAIKQLPPAQAKRGKWISADAMFGGVPFYCSECGENTRDTVMGKPRWNFCPNCGADMREETT